MSFRSVLSMLVLFLALVVAAPTVAQEEESGTSGRLPPYFKEVVTEEQKQTIYQIQSRYDEKLETLEKQYEQLTAQVKKLREDIDAIRFEERDAIDKVLTPQQLAQVKKAQAEAQARLAQELLKAAEAAAKRAEELSQPE